MDLEIKAMCETKVKADMEEAEKWHSQFLIYSLEIKDRMSVKNKNFFNFRVRICVWLYLL